MPKKKKHEELIDELNNIDYLEENQDYRRKLLKEIDKHNKELYGYPTLGSKTIAFLFLIALFGAGLYFIKLDPELSFLSGASPTGFAIMAEQDDFQLDQDGFYLDAHITGDAIILNAFTENGNSCLEYSVDEKQYCAGSHECCVALGIRTTSSLDDSIAVTGMDKGKNIFKAQFYTFSSDFETYSLKEASSEPLEFEFNVE